jgi:hypothetical protein
MIFAFSLDQKEVGLEIPNPSRMDALIGIIFEILNQEKVSPEEAFILAEEILASSLERLAKQNNLSVEELREKIAKSLMHKSPSQPRIGIGSNRGWVGNPKALRENN